MDSQAFVSLAEFSRRSSLSRGTIYNLVDRGDLPKPIRLTPNRVAFPAAVVDAWFTARVSEATK
ncbi:MAG: AlpA family phage regulatory protein [Caulobacteraceae bacterium]|nr:AlpA family phage regulatory protein [Caulobacteraceae bacterium]